MCKKRKHCPLDLQQKIDISNDIESGKKHTVIALCLLASLLVTYIAYNVSIFWSQEIRYNEVLL